MTLVGDAATLATAQLRVELRSRTGLAASAAIGAIALVLVAFAAGPDVRQLRDLGPGLMWLGLLYGVMALADRLDASLHQHDAHGGLWLVVADRRSIYLGSVAALTVLLFGLIVGLTLLASILLSMPLSAADVPLLLGTGALAAVAAGTVAVLVGALISASAQRVLLGPIILLPLLAPVLIAGTGVVRSLVSDDSGAVIGWLAVLAIQATLCAGIGLLTYEAAAAPE